MDSLEFARMLWQQFGLSDSQGAGMTLTENGKVTKQHGKATNTDDCKEMGESIVHYQTPKAKK